MTFMRKFLDMLNINKQNTKPNMIEEKEDKVDWRINA